MARGVDADAAPRPPGDFGDLAGLGALGSAAGVVRFPAGAAKAAVSMDSPLAPAPSSTVCTTGTGRLDDLRPPAASEPGITCRPSWRSRRMQPMVPHASYLPTTKRQREFGNYFSPASQSNTFSRIMKPFWLGFATGRLTGNLVEKGARPFLCASSRRSLPHPGAPPNLVEGAGHRWRKLLSSFRDDARRSREMRQQAKATASKCDSDMPADEVPGFFTLLHTEPGPCKSHLGKISIM